MADTGLREQLRNSVIQCFEFTYEPYSDLDLAVITTRALPLEQMAAISDAFANSDLPIRVVVVDWSSCSEVFRQIIAHNKIIVQLGSVVP